MRYLKGVTVSLGVLIVSFVMILLWGQWDPEAFLIDDNRTQWFPVMERAYADFFRTGSMPVYDFYQMKGMSIADPGYYGIVNPLMLLSYVLSHFAGLPFSTMTIHIGLLFSLGNVCFYWFCRSIGRKWWEALLCTGAYAGMSSVFAFGYWYYAFNNFLFIPLLLLVFWKSRDRKLGFFACGSVLALEILFGNVQYTCYHYMLFAMLCLMFVLLGKKRYIGIFFSNIAVAVGLSAPFLLQLMRSSGSFGGGEFHIMDIGLLELLFGALVPCGILQKLGIQNLPFSDSAMDRDDYTWLWNGGFAAFWLTVGVGAVIWLIRNRKRLTALDFKQERTLKEWGRCFSDAVKKWYHGTLERSDESHLMLLGLLLCVWFFTSFIADGLVAWILGAMPVIKQFRFLFKCIFILQPLTAVLTVAAWPYIRGRIKMIAVSACCVFVAVGLLNNAFVTGDIVRSCFTDAHTATLSEEQEHGAAILRGHTPDMDTYRYMTLLQTDVYVTPETFHYDNAFMRNFATTMGVFSLSGYEISAPEAHLQQFDELYDCNNIYTRMVNCGMASHFVQSAEYRPEETEAQLISNAVRYIFVQKQQENVQFSYFTEGYGNWEKTDCYARISAVQEDLLDTDFTALVCEALESLEHVSIAEVRSVNDYYDVIVLDGVNGLCTDGEGAALPLMSRRMDTISFVAGGAASYTLSFAYEEGLTAWSEDVFGMRTPLEISADENGDTVVHADGLKNTTIYLSYQDTLSLISFAFEGVIVLLFGAMLLGLLREGRKQSK